MSNRKAIGIDLGIIPRDAFVSMAENLGIDMGEAENLVDLYLAGADKIIAAEVGSRASTA